MNTYTRERVISLSVPFLRQEIRFLIILCVILRNL